MVRGGIHRVRIASLLFAAAICGCSNGAGAATNSPAPPTAAPGTDAPIPTRPPLVLEDAGLESELAPGAYTSRVFEPVIRIELGTGWFRRDPIGQHGFNLRAGPNGDRDFTFVSGIDFLQCGDGAAIASPTAAAIVEAIGGSPALTITSRRDVPVAGVTGVELRFEGDPDVVIPEDDLDAWLAFGCMLTQGDGPFPTGERWIGALADMNQQLVVVDVAGTTLLIRGRPSTVVDDHYDAILEIVAGMSIG